MWLTYSLVIGSEPVSLPQARQALAAALPHESKGTKVRGRK